MNASPSFIVRAQKTEKEPALQVKKIIQNEETEENSKIKPKQKKMISDPVMEVASKIDTDDNSDGAMERGMKLLAERLGEMD